MKNRLQLFSIRSNPKREQAVEGARVLWWCNVAFRKALAREMYSLKRRNGYNVRYGGVAVLDSMRCELVHDEINFFC